MILFDFECANGHTTEELVKSDVRQIQCPVCMETAERQISTPRIDRVAMALQEGATETSLRHFERIHQQQKVKEERSFRNHGDYGKSPGSD